MRAKGPSTRLPAVGCLIPLYDVRPLTGRHCEQCKWLVSGIGGSWSQAKAFPVSVATAVRSCTAVRSSERTEIVDIRELT